MGVGRADAEQYGRQLRQLLPPGRLLPTDPTSILGQLLEAWGAVLAAVHNRSLDLVEEADPRTTLELLAEWERYLGLPDDCVVQPETLQERRAAVVERLTSLGGQSPQRYIDAATALGYSITILEFRPFITGRSRVGDIVGADEDDRFYWKVTVHEPRVTYFRTGESRIGDSLGAIDRAEDLECVLERIKPAHSTLIFSYEGA